MTKATALSILYSVSHIAAGLLLHPYQTMQSLVKERVFAWMTGVPLYFLACITVLWRWAFVPVVQLVFSCSSCYFFACDALSFISNTLVFFCLYWQILLAYLFLRFRLLIDRKSL